MKARLEYSIRLVVVAALASVLAGRVSAQTFTTLHSFADEEGSYPLGELILLGNTLYGTTANGGGGTVFAVHTDGIGFTNLHTFTYGNDGGNPASGLVLSGNIFYGTTASGGSSGSGTVFAVNTDGTGFTNLHSFSAASSPLYINSDGVSPLAGLVLLGNTLYGTASRGGYSGHGTVFALNTDGIGFTNLFSFDGFSDGSDPSTLLLLGETLYGTTDHGGYSDNGTVFKLNKDGLNKDGTGFTSLTSFSGGRLIISSNNLYGTTEDSVFALNTDGSGFTTLYNFTNSTPPGPSGLVLSGKTLYGTTFQGGSWGNGTVFAVTTDGSEFRSLYSFTQASGPLFGVHTNSDGAGPQAGLILSGHTLYGTASEGGRFGNGTVFSISFTPQLTITPYGTNVILTWPTNYAGFDYTGYRLQSTTNLASPVWTTNLPAPWSGNGQNIVINPISSTQQFFRLSQ
jgi:uncharacterized repeat protein (TIGR03803 family)